MATIEQRRDLAVNARAAATPKNGLPDGYPFTEQEMKDAVDSLLSDYQKYGYPNCLHISDSDERSGQLLAIADRP